MSGGMIPLPSPDMTLPTAYRHILVNFSLFIVLLLYESKDLCLSDLNFDISFYITHFFE